MIYTEKIDLYNTLVSEVRNCPYLDKCNQIKGKNTVQLEKCELCDEVNLWAYWQGGRNNLDADILLVGQDWGNYKDKNGNLLLEFIEGRKTNSQFPYLPTTPKSITDINLIRLFDECLGITIGPQYVSNPKLFFTNFVMCYRKQDERISSGFKKSWANNCKEYFIKLVNIIEPKIVICLGRSVFDSVLKAAGKPTLKGSYNVIIERSYQILKIGNVECAVFPVAHCGTFGTLNRNEKKNDSLEIQKKDWRRIKEYLDNNNI